MIEKKRIRFANTIGKPLVSVREINIEGKGKKIEPRKRKSIPANLSKIAKKREDALRRAEKNVADEMEKFKNLRRRLDFEKNAENIIKNEMSKQMKKRSLFGKKPNIEHFKNKLEESNKEKKKIMQKMMKAKLDLNMAIEKRNATIKHTRM